MGTISKKTTKRFKDLHKNTNFLNRLENENLKDEAKGILEIFQFCETNKINVFGTTSQLNLVEKYLDEIENFNSMKNKNTKVFETKLFMLNLETILFQSIKEVVDKNKKTPASSAFIDACEEKTQVLSNFLESNRNVSFVEILSYINKKTSGKSGSGGKGGSGGKSGSGGLKQVLTELYKMRAELQAELSKASSDIINAIKNNKGGIDQLSKEIAGLEGLMKISLEEIGKIDAKITTEEEKTRKYITDSEKTIIDTLTKKYAEGSAEFNGLIYQLMGKIEEIKNGINVSSFDFSSIEEGLKSLNLKNDETNNNLLGMTDKLNTRITQSALDLKNEMSNLSAEIKEQQKNFEALAAYINELSAELGNDIKTNSGEISELSKSFVDKMSGVSEKLGEMDKNIILTEEKIRQHITDSEKTLLDSNKKQRDEFIEYFGVLSKNIEEFGKKEIVSSEDFVRIEERINALGVKADEINVAFSEKIDKLDMKFDEIVIRFAIEIEKISSGLREQQNAFELGQSKIYELLEKVFTDVNTNKGEISNLSDKFSTVLPSLNNAIEDLKKANNNISLSDEKVRQYITESESRIIDETKKQRDEFITHITTLTGKLDEMESRKFVSPDDLLSIDERISSLQTENEEMGRSLSERIEKVYAGMSVETQKIMLFLEEKSKEHNGQMDELRSLMEHVISGSAPSPVPGLGVVPGSGASATAVAEIKAKITEFDKKLADIQAVQEEILLVSREDSGKLAELIDTYSDNMERLNEKDKKYTSMVSSIKKKVSAVLAAVAVFGVMVVLTFSFMVANNKAINQKLDNLDAKVESVLVLDPDDPSIPNISINQETSLSLALYIIENQMYDHENLTKFTQGDIKKHEEALVALYGSEISVPMQREIVGIVNEYITKANAERSAIVIENGEGYTITSNRARIDQGSDIVLTMTIHEGYVFNPEENTLQISNATYGGIQPSVDGNKIVIVLNNVTANTFGASIGFGFGDLKKESHIEDDNNQDDNVQELGSIFMDVASQYGQFKNIDDGASLEYGFSFDFEPNDPYNKTQPIFTANGKTIQSVRNEDGTYTFNIIPDDLINGDVTIEDETDWKINRYTISYEKNTGWDFYKPTTSIGHGNNFTLLVKIDAGYENAPVLVYTDKDGNEIEVMGAFMEGSKNFYKYFFEEIVDDITISGEALQGTLDNSNTSGSDSSTSNH